MRGGLDGGRAVGLGGWATYRILPPRASRKLNLSHTTSASLPGAEVLHYQILQRTLRNLPGNETESEGRIADRCRLYVKWTCVSSVVVKLTPAITCHLRPYEDGPKMNARCQEMRDTKRYEISRVPRITTYRECKI